MLSKAARLLQPPEQLCFVTGCKFPDLLRGRIIVITDLVFVEAVSSRVHVTPSPASLFHAHQRLLRMGMDLEGLLHTHPGVSREATRPSPIDLETQRRWETGAPFLGGIFSEGGRYVRFFNHSQLSEVIIYGNC